MTNVRMAVRSSAQITVAEAENPSQKWGGIRPALRPHSCDGFQIHR